MESRDISHYSSPTKTFNTPVSHTSNLSTKTSANPNNQLPHFDPFKPAEYVLNNLGPVPGEEKIYAKIFKKNEQNVQNTSSNKRNINTSRPTSVPQQQSMEIEDTNLLVTESNVNHTPVTESQTDDAHLSSVGNPKSVKDDSKSVKDDSKSVKGDSVIVISDDENDKPKDGDHNGDKDKLLRLYSHKLHIRKPRIPYSRICTDDSGILSDSDEFA
ncbi:hypothetical protein C2G38_2042670 [Gigaspora rosea]|uniref:Uncharacterized protein n=1 Tax=Gigaspora rosea TaxID=44941 RepID=A0A397UMJ4_9GLOM|nr:hypothetical protein C2G38_2042670 [Gigaspora rosea]